MSLVKKLMVHNQDRALVKNIEISALVNCRRDEEMTTRTAEGGGDEGTTAAEVTVEA